ncbi:MAG TPA: hypothetical protein VGI04_07385 [Neobacillus sp.]
MEKEMLALNYALMLEMMKAKGFSNSTIVALLNEGNEELLESIGEGIPTWRTLIDYYHFNKAKIHRALKAGYEITFLTKGALKSLLLFRFDLKEGEDFVDTGELLDKIILSSDQLQELREVISKNWTILVMEEDSEQDTIVIKIELTYQPVFNR